MPAPHRRAEYSSSPEQIRENIYYNQDTLVVRAHKQHSLLGIPLSGGMEIDELHQHFKS